MESIVLNPDGISTRFRMLDQRLNQCSYPLDRPPHLSIRLRKDGLHVQCDTDGGSFSSRDPLRFSNTKDRADNERLYIEAVLQTLNPKGLLFLENIKSYDIAVYHDSGTLKWRRQAKVSTTGDGLSIVETADNLKGPSKWTCAGRYGVAKWLGAKPIAVAFPIDKAGNPLVERQQRYCFMTRKLGPYKFILHVDSWDTHLSGDHRLHELLARAIADCLNTVTAVPALKYTWMRYLPDRLFADGSPSLIATCLSSVPLLLDREGAHSTIPEVFAYADNQLDDHENPLFPAVDDNQRYLSLRYKSQDREILRFYGLQRVTTEDMILRVRVLANSKDWPGFVKNKDSSWHNRLSSWTSRVFGRDLTAGVLALLSLVPGGVDRALSNWNGSPGTIYFPEISGVPLPDGLPIVKLDPKACADRDNRALYASLGVSIADPVKIEEIILLHHSLWKPQGDKQSQIATSLGSLRFIYEMLQMGKLERTRDRDLVVFDRSCCPKRPKKESVYLSSASWLGTGALASLSGQEGIADIESTLSFLHESYLRDSPRLLSNIKFKMTWVDFLLQVVGLHKDLRIFTRQSQDVAVSLPFLALAQRWPGRVLEWLYQVYREDPGRWNRKPDITTALKKMQIVCTNGMGFPLSETILPLPSLLSTFPGLFGDLCKALPFLKLEKPLDENDEELCSQWKLFAAHFGVIHADDIRLSLAALKTWMRKDARPGQISVTLAVVNIYHRIQRQQNAATAKFIRTWFDENPGLLCTPQLETKGRPVPPKWGYRQASDKVPMAMVAHAWVPVFNRLQPVHRANLMAFFRDTLGLEFDTNMSKLMNSPPSENGDSSPNPSPSKSTVIPAPPSKSLKNIKVRLPPADTYVKSREKLDGKSAAEKQVKAGKTGSNASFPLRAESIFEFGKEKRTTFAFKGL